MFRKAKLKKEIKACQERIEQLEAKRIRSQAALVEAILNKTSPEKEDVERFHMYTGLIDREREQMRKLNGELNSLE